MEQESIVLREVIHTDEKNIKEDNLLILQKKMWLALRPILMISSFKAVFENNSCLL